MTDKATLTVELDPGLKEQLEKAARAHGTSVDQAAIAALRMWTLQRCPTCGRPNLVDTTPAGMSAEFVSFHDQYKEGKLGPVTITTVEGGEQRVYWVRLRSDRPLEGMLMVYALLGQHQNAYLPIGIPRGVITGWRGDSDGTWYGMCVALGYVDGNAPARQVARLMREQGEL